MKNYILLLLVVVVGLVSCNTEAMKPEFQRVDNIEVLDLTKNNVSVTAGLTFLNPNPISIDLNTIDLEVYINDVKVGDVNQAEKITMTKKSEFTVPMTINFKPADLFKKNLQGAMQVAAMFIEEQKFDIVFKGSSEFGVKGINIEIPVDYTDEITLYGKK